MNTCDSCGRYTRPNTDLCLLCLKEQNSKPYPKRYFEEKPINYVKGHIGEALIQNLFSSQGFMVLKYGIENNLTFLSEFLSEDDLTSAEITFIKNRPDLMVLNPVKRKLYFIEVKYTSKGVISLDTFSDEYPYNSCYMIVISKDVFRCVKVKDFKAFEKKEDILNDDYLLRDNEEFNLDKGLVSLFENNANGIYNAISKLN